MPDCCVCLTAMLEDLCVLKCGHVFHSFWYGGRARQAPGGPGP